MLFLIIRESNPALHGLKLRGGHFRSSPENQFLILFGSVEESHVDIQLYIQYYFD
jgi:hypothetical protein